MGSVLRRTVLSALMIGAFTIAFGTPAQAGVEDGAAAVLTNAQDVIDSQIDWTYSEASKELPSLPGFMASIPVVGEHVIPPRVVSGGGLPDVLPGGGSARTETCRVDAGGRELAQRVNYAIGEVYGQDLGIGVGECADLQFGDYTCTVTVTIEYLVTSGALSGTWQSTGYKGSTSGSSSGQEGLCVPSGAALAHGLYAGTSPYLDKYHRAHARLWTSRGSFTEAFSPVWFMAR